MNSFCLGPFAPQWRNKQIKWWVKEAYVNGQPFFFDVPRNKRTKDINKNLIQSNKKVITSI